MGSELIHYEALRKQMIIDRRNLLDIQKKVTLGFDSDKAMISLLK
jgi:hypothetical protein